VWPAIDPLQPAFDALRTTSDGRTPTIASRKSSIVCGGRDEYSNNRTFLSLYPSSASLNPTFSPCRTSGRPRRRTVSTNATDGPRLQPDVRASSLPADRCRWPVWMGRRQVGIDRWRVDAGRWQVDADRREVWIGRRQIDAGRRQVGFERWSGCPQTAAVSASSTSAESHPRPASTWQRPVEARPTPVAGEHRSCRALRPATTRRDPLHSESTYGFLTHDWSPANLAQQRHDRWAARGTAKLQTARNYAVFVARRPLSLDFGPVQSGCGPLSNLIGPPAPDGGPPASLIGPPPSRGGSPTSLGGTPSSVGGPPSLITGPIFTTNRTAVARSRALLGRGRTALLTHRPAMFGRRTSVQTRRPALVTHRYRSVRGRSATGPHRPAIRRRRTFFDRRRLSRDSSRHFRRPLSSSSAPRASLRIRSTAMMPRDRGGM
jgi:hypothetical protein